MSRVYKLILRRIREHQASKMGNGWGEAWLKSPYFTMVASALLEFMIEQGATNYVETYFQELKTGRRIVVTCQYADGKSPAELRQEAEAQADALAAEVQRLTEQRNNLAATVESLSADLGDLAAKALAVQARCGGCFDEIEELHRMAREVRRDG